MDTKKQRLSEEEKQQFLAWWKTATYEERLAVMNSIYDRRKEMYAKHGIHQQEQDQEKVPAEDVAKIDDISSDWSLLNVLPKYINWAKDQTGGQ